MKQKPYIYFLRIALIILAVLDTFFWIKYFQNQNNSLLILGIVLLIILLYGLYYLVRQIIIFKLGKMINAKILGVYDRYSDYYKAMFGRTHRRNTDETYRTYIIVEYYFDNQQYKELVIIEPPMGTDMFNKKQYGEIKELPIVAYKNHCIFNEEQFIANNNKIQ